MLKCLIIDDEELARTLLKTYADKVDYLEVVGTYENPVEALGIIKDQAIDRVFLDIQMPDLKGTTLASMLPENCQVIFTTAYTEYALEGFELNAVDYLLKPITFERFLQAVNKLKSSKKVGEIRTITVKSGYDLHKLFLDDIYFIESDGEYVHFHTKNKKVMSYQSLRSLEKILDPSLFMRVHRSYIVNKTKVRALKGRDLSIEEHAIPVSDTYIEKVKSELF
jgi:DNA-binding LytR/AlgR family response regulator